MPRVPNGLATAVLIAAAAATGVHGAAGFAPATFLDRGRAAASTSPPPIRSALHAAATIEEAAPGPARQVDSNGTELAEGQIVRVIVAMKAFHVPKKDRGKFDPETKAFVPAETDKKRGDNCLEVPVGMRGVVTRVYDTNDISASHPVLVKFAPGEHSGDGYDPPATFLMHFRSKEVEVV
uniref:Ferredoxin thioredoxin reductase alpha chain domain-containing protein n=1 Tax=Trieres chinensis TaxID=1514140 RepID=A0A7S2A786_TRICV|mmetsp:Transcript_5585/g.11639  ORF Transcript_5585/g.11639 Transcript_5585/m.11639 type:complete len:180 (+) Transcript_5585:70-609(+)